MIAENYAVSSASHLARTKDGNIFDGIIKDAILGVGASGTISECAKYPDGAKIMTSRIVQLGEVDGMRYIETESRSRYIIESVSPETGQNFNCWFEFTKKRLDAHSSYYKSKQWS